jgi:phosphoserine phosphatase RsbU/P
MWSIPVPGRDGDRSTYDLPPGKELVIGRDPTADVVLSERSVSRRHCRVAAGPAGIDVTDLNSANGTWVSGKQIDRTRLKSGESLLIGNVRVTVALREGPTGMVGLVDDSSQVSDSDATTSSSSGGRPSLLDLSRAAYGGLEKERLALLIEAGKSLSTAGGSQQVVERIMDHLFQILPVKRAALVLSGPDGRLSARSMRPAVEAGELSQMCSRHIVQQVMDDKKPRIVEDASLDSALNQAHSILFMNVRAAICAPLLAQDRAIGAIYADYPGKAKLYSQSDLDFFGAFGGIAAVALENSRLEEEARDRMRLQRDLEIAAELQRGLLPTAAFNHPALDIDWAYRPSRLVGGDFYDCVTLDDGRVVLTLGDVSGKSIGAALYMARVMSFLRASLADDPTPGRVLEKTNALLADGRDPDVATFATAAFLLVDAAEGTIRWASAGHNPVLVYSPDTATFEDLGATGPPLGVVPDVPFFERSCLLPKGASVLLYSDGLVEARDKTGAFFGLDNVKTIVERVHERGPKELSLSLLSAVEAHWADSEYIKDDFALLAARLR